MSIEEQIRNMSLEEKASLCSGRDFWTTKPIDRFGIPSIMMTDGPHGMRKAVESDQVGLHGSVPSTCFPSGSALAASWNRELIAEVSAAMGEEAQSEGVNVLLGPAVNIKRSPLCGRNFEYLSEDPYLAGELAKHYVSGLQSAGVGTSIKHFAANNQERYRLVTDAIVDERALREIYLPAFEKAVKESSPWTVMCAYNKLNGTYCSENRWLLTTVLREEWGYRGLVVTDWGACNDRVAGIIAGQDLEMPGNGGLNDRAVVAAVRSGKLDERLLDETVARVLHLVSVSKENARSGVKFDAERHHALARQVAGECIVLLKNADSLLPLQKGGKIAVVGSLAKHPRFQGGGSSHINPTHLDNAFDEIEKSLDGAGEIAYADGYLLEEEKPETALIEEAARVAASADLAVVFIGLPDSFESEGFDRSDLDIPRAHSELLAAVRRVQKHVVVVLRNGSPVSMPWLDSADAVLEAYLGGQAGAGALADVLFGEVNPSGRLAETFPARLEDTPCYLNFPGDKHRVEYREGVFVGYRHFDALRLKPLFPFGFGLSYTSFEYTNLRLDRETMEEDDVLGVTVTIKNTGMTKGKEVVQLYVHDEAASVARPPKELKGFEKVELAPGESSTVRFSLDRRAFAFWDLRSGSWRVEEGNFSILVGASSRDIRLQGRVMVHAAAPVRTDYDFNSPLGDFYDHTVVGRIARSWREEFLAGWGGEGEGANGAERADRENIGRMMRAMIDEFPLRALVGMSGTVSRESVTLFLDVANRVQPADRLSEVAEQPHSTRPRSAS